MTRRLKIGGCTFLVCLVLPVACAQTLQFLPELDVNFRATSIVRFNVQVKGEREAGEQEQFQAGPSIQLYLKPLVKLKHVTAFDLNDSKSRFLVLETGYRYIAAPNAAPEDRIIVAATAHFPVGAGLLLTDRNRADLDSQRGNFTWRYRNKVTLERTLSIHSYHLIPYVAVEPYYLSQYGKWSTTALYAGCLFAHGKHFQFNSYYEHENNTGKRPNRQDREIGLALHIFIFPETR